MEKQESETERHNGNKCGKLSNNTNRKKNDRSAWGSDRK